MFRTRVLYLWLQMIGLTLVLLTVAAFVAATFTDDFKTAAVLLLVPFAFVLYASMAAIAGFLPMLILMQRLLVATGTRTGRPAEFQAFRSRLSLYSLVPATFPFMALLLPQLRPHSGPLAGLLLLWALSTLIVWRFNARRLHQEWNAGQPY
ncbi:hypothetical protein [Hymenobacter koreensis]|uniref:MFS transporter n=1 Tax=Hymenobacter koreensis TaxID=1084523 RepID=A0ABP8IT87_9BACT